MRSSPRRRVVIDFTLVDFQAMFKFIDIEEVRHTRTMSIDSYQLWKKMEKKHCDEKPPA